jgi:putative component of membrane protein insertase Oxa1/YidC/SpoIIIJ protein YidD
MTVLLNHKQILISAFVLALPALLLAQPATTTKLALALELASENDWEACQVECLRMESRAELTDTARQLRAKATMMLDGRQHRKRSVLARIGSLPIEALVGFYRLVVAPALGARCSLSPSCSSYSLQAARERGWLGIPMTADRLIREPSVVMAGKNPFKDANHRTLYPDPVSDHIGGKQKSEKENHNHGAQP